MIFLPKEKISNWNIISIQKLKKIIYKCRQYYIGGIFIKKTYKKVEIYEKILKVKIIFNLIKKILNKI